VRAPRCSQPPASSASCANEFPRRVRELREPATTGAPPTARKRAPRRVCVWEPREPAAGGAPRRVRAGAVRGGHVGSRRGPSAASWWCAVADQRSFRQVPPVPPPEHPTPPPASSPRPRRFRSTGDEHLCCLCSCPAQRVRQLIVGVDVLLLAI